VGYLILGERVARQEREARARRQIEIGATIDILTADDLAERYPWLNVEDLGIGTFGIGNEGWFDAWSLLHWVGMRRESAT
jgi:FAD-dependent oxidoreductase domain-containing protein 1